MFEFNKSHKEIQKAARDFAKGEFDKTYTLELEEKRKFPDKIWGKAADLGFIGIQFDEKYSGGSLGIFEAALIAEEFCRIDSTMGMALTLCASGSEAVYRFAENDLKEKFLSKICEGEMRCAIAFSESDHGLDLSSINTSAVIKGDKLVINGEKAHVTDIGAKGFYLVLCKTDPTNDSPEKYLSMVLVEADNKNIFLEDSGEKFSLNMMKSAGLTFKDVKMPISNIVGKEGKGFHQLENFLNEMRIITAAQALGTAQGALDRAVEYIKQREQFNRKIAKFQIIQHKIADMATKVELARLITYKAAYLFDEGRIETALISMAKMTAARAAVEVADEAIQLFGGYGYMKESEVERFFRDAKMAELKFGNRAAQQDIIGRAVIGKIKRKRK
ncbi:MAG: acyl-CoA/acyl-ACP dehydrogenase [Deltaproteobacteria bacterium]|jgi:alkylation response protein AidB-like acyl-CoA dehydrogenase|nr:acyl-CoA/acyl-ACP dehydrogenase [Deltaproteobacteria bacterium]